MIGIYRCTKTDVPSICRTEEFSFLLASDTQTSLLGITKPDSKETSFFLANSGNPMMISVDANLDSESAFDVSQGMRVEFLIEQKNFPIKDSFESRFLAVKTETLAIPLFLAWDVMGVPHQVVLDALQGKPTSGSNDLGTFSISGQNGIATILFDKTSANLWHHAKTLRLRDATDQVLMTKNQFPSGVKSIRRRYSFAPERKRGAYEPFKCTGTIEYTSMLDRTFVCEVEIDVHTHKDALAARQYMDEFIARIPSDKPIVSRSALTKVLKVGRETVAVDLEVEKSGQREFSNTRSVMYYVFVVFALCIVLGVAYRRWLR